MSDKNKDLDNFVPSNIDRIIELYKKLDSQHKKLNDDIAKCNEHAAIPIQIPKPPQLTADELEQILTHGSASEKADALISQLKQHKESENSLKLVAQEVDEKIKESRRERFFGYIRIKISSIIIWW